MNTTLDMSLANSYHSASQIARVVTEGWIAGNMFCPRCGENRLRHFVNNRPVADFYCPRCDNQFELKSKNGTITSSISDGAYNTMIDRITSNTNPDFFVMEYHLGQQPCVNNLIVIPKFFFTPDIIIKRAPLASTARRAGWVGCNINISSIPSQGKISSVDEGVSIDKPTVLKCMEIADRLKMDRVESRGWVFDTLTCINKISSNAFSLTDVYDFSDYLAALHPNNHNIHAKIRQQLQILRDRGIIKFLDNGAYEKV